MSLVTTLQVDRSGLRQVDNETAFLELVDVLLHRDHLERAQALGLFELLHIKSPKTSVVEDP
jgi:hypothetical protein